MAFQSVILKNYVNVFEEYAAAAAITPGMLVEPTPGAATIRKHATAQGNCLPMFAIEDALQGNGIDDDYAAGDVVRCWIPQRGDVVNALLRDEENVAIGDFLESDGYGRLQEHADDSSAGTTGIIQNAIVGVALEAKNLSTLPEGSESSAGGTYHNPRIKVRII